MEVPEHCVASLIAVRERLAALEAELTAIEAARSTSRRTFLRDLADVPTWGEFIADPAAAADVRGVVESTVARVVVRPTGRNKHVALAPGSRSPGASPWPRRGGERPPPGTAPDLRAEVRVRP